MSMSPTHPYVFESLRQSAIAYEDNMRTKGFSEFHNVCVSSKKAECGVYEKLWEILKKPIGDSEFGRNAFHDANGKYSTLEQKANAITRYMIANKMIPSELVVLDARTNLYSLSEKAVEILEKMDKKLSDILNWEPKNPTAKIPFKLFKISMKIASLFLCIKAGVKVGGAITSGFSGTIPTHSISKVATGLDLIDSTGRVIVGSMKHVTDAKDLTKRNLQLLSRYEAINASRLDESASIPFNDKVGVNWKHKSKHEEKVKTYSCPKEEKHRQRAEEHHKKAKEHVKKGREEMDATLKEGEQGHLYSASKHYGNEQKEFYKGVKEDVKGCKETRKADRARDKEIAKNNPKPQDRPQSHETEKKRNQGGSGSGYLGPF